MTLPVDLSGSLGIAFDRGVVAFHDDPGGFARECVRWPRGRKTGVEGGPADYQLEILRALVEYRRVAARGPRGLGKTTTEALAILWFALTRDAAQEDWKVIVTAGGWGQLVSFLWPEVRTKLAPRLDWARIGRAPFDLNMELMRRELRLRFGAVSMGAPSDAAKIEGAHADELLYVMDEAKSIPDDTWRAIEGALSGAGEDTDQSAYQLAASTPGAPEGIFYDIHSGAEGYGDWFAIHVPLERALAAKRVAAKWPVLRAEQYGVDSAFYQNHVLGEFAREAQDSVIRMSHLEAAQERWREFGFPWGATRGDVGVPMHDELVDLGVVGVDVARGGKDKTVFALRHGDVVSQLVLRPREPDTTVCAGEVLSLLARPERPAVAVVDANGVGGPVADMIRREGGHAVDFIAQAKTGVVAKATRQGFADTRAAAWWCLREMLEPESGCELAIPPDDQLAADLLAPTWKVEANGRIRVESKDDIRKRLKRSTDAGDAVVQAYWTDRTQGLLSNAPEVLRRAGGSRNLTSGRYRSFQSKSFSRAR